MYQNFARYYDELIRNVDYVQMAAFLDRQIRQHKQCEGSILLDLACGTGNLSLELAAMGYDVIGVDGSDAMLSQAMDKAADRPEQILFLCQNMMRLDLYGTVDAAVCTLDSLNHLADAKQLERVLGRVALFLDPGGVFCFDLNTPYKHEQVLGNETFVYDCGEVFCVWQNTYQQENCSVEIQLDFFEREQDGRYDRACEIFKERAYSAEELEQILARVGLRIEARFDGYTEQPAHERSERVVYVCRKAEK